ncbi:hypothetical protein DWB68_01730 [Galactobacter valiniphilus]|uniref:LPXTG cell wall anchor domain-containing protein n=1 Tax=Galactobacter valiniphilus TaxID=2676122 RepID=A0A399JDL4_9MICC|nr:SdrD B-like domain-containing protein [Galactobacter valiniphilus]RII43638.1 hypothetical protein DWB68_01730 [Galactobacter valiniphilus]
MSLAPANAAPDSNPLSATVNHVAWANGKPVPGAEVKPGEVLNPGADLMLAVGYGPQEGQTWSDLAGKSFEFSVKGPITSLTGDLTNNEAIKSFVVSPTNPNKLVLTFADKIAADTVEGYVFAVFKAQSEKNSSTEPISWDLGASNTGQVEVTVKGTESKPAPTKNEQSKSVNNAKPDLFNVDQSAGNKTPSERISIKPGALDTEFTYTLNVTSLAADADYPIVDELPAGLVLVPGRFSVSQTRWESASSDSPITVPGVTFDPTVTADGFEGTLDVPAFSVTTITYKLKVKDQATLDGWYQDFLAKVAADENFETGKNFDIAALKNTASFGPGAVEKSATVNIKDGWGNMAEVGPDGAFGKSASPRYSIPVLNEDGTLAAPVAVEFTLNANLNSWDGSTNLKPKLKENVVITDRLSTNYTWAPQDAGFISATGIRANDATGTGAAQLTLSEATGFSGPAADFASDAYVGKWSVDAASNTLYVNVGKSQYTNASVKVATQLVNVKGLTADDKKVNTPGNVTGTEYFHAKNTASFTYTDKKGNPASKDKTAENTVVKQDERREGARDKNHFSKSLGTDKVSVKSGEAAVVPFAFEAKGIKGFDPSKTTIVDYVDTNMFDLRDEAAASAAVKTSLKANYNGSALKAEDFEVQVSAAAGTVTLKYTGAVSATGKDLRVEFSLSTYPVYGKQVLDITNKAVLFGEDGLADYWDRTTTTATNYGFEAQVKKTLYNTANKKLTDILQSETVNGEYVQKTYVYRVQVIPRGGYQGVKMRTLVDHLPVGTEFVGFIADEDMDTADNAKGQDGTPYALKQGNLEAVFTANPDATVESTPGDVVLRQKAGTTFPANTDAVWLNLAVKITSKKNGVPVVNTLGGSTAIIVPNEEGDTTVPLPIQKLDAKTGAALTDRDSRFEVKGTGANADFTAVAFAENGYLVVANAEDPEGAGKLLRVPAAGTYTVTETKAPYGYTANTEPVTFTVDENGKITSPFKAFYNEPIAYALGDFTWIDSNKNGVQDEGEPVLAGVKVTLLDGAGNVALDMDGKEVKAVKTDANGRYVFDNLPVGQYNVRFELTDAQTKKYTFTQANVAGNDDRTDSDATVSAENAKIGETGVFTLGKFGGNNDGKFTSAADYATELGLAEGTQAFKAAGGIDQTRDAGVMLKDSVSVGDYVWFDKNKDGQQGEQKDEPGIKGVVLTITGPDGKPVTDVFGDPVNPTTTDDKGYYTFENLPVLKAGESYTVTIDRADKSTQDALAEYTPTKETDPASEGYDRSKDSNTWEASSEGLTNDGDRDPTLDFGFIKKTYAVGDYTWIDANKDGLQSEGEEILADVKVELLDEDGNVLGETVTNEQGFYLFDELNAGTYQVRFTLTEAQAKKYTFTMVGAGGEDDSDAKPEADNAAVGVTKTFVLNHKNAALVSDEEYEQADLKATEGIDPTWDAGVIINPSVSVGDYVWFDENKDGIQGDPATEPGIPGVVLEVYGPDGKKVETDAYGQPVGPQTTDKDGKYSFDHLPVLGENESYTVKIVRDDPSTQEALAEYVPTQELPEGDRTTDSNTWEASSEGLTNDGDRDPTLDFGFIKANYAVGDYTWIDANKDGLQSEGEEILAGVKVELLDAEGKVVATTVTNGKGFYLFDELPAGDYQIRFTLTDEQAKKYNFTSVGDGAADDSDAKPASPTAAVGTTKVFTLNSSNPNLVPAAEYENGEFKANKGIDPTWDAGVVLKPRVSLGDYVWFDENRDGIQDETEPGIPGVVLEVYGPDGKKVETDVFGDPVKPVTTGDKGEYTFENLPVLPEGEKYTVKIVRDHPSTQKALEDLTPTVPNAGGDRGKDSSTWEATTEGLNEDGDRDPTLDFGFVKASYAIGDYTWIDLNQDGLQTEGEPVLPGVTVTLTDKHGQPVKDVYGNVVKPVQTDEFGKYVFDELPSGEYTVSFTLTPEQAKRYSFTKLGEGSADDSDAKVSEDPAVGFTKLVVLDRSNANLSAREGIKASEGIDPTWDAGVIQKSVRVGDYVWVDTDKDGRQDPNEPGIPEVWLKIVDKDGNPVKDVYGNEVPPVKTDKNGKYIFEDLPVLPEGEHYKVIIDREKSKKALAKYKPTQSNAGNREGDSDEWESTTQGLNEGGDEDLTLDFGFVLADDGIDVGGVGQTRPASTDDGIDVGGVGQTRPADGDGMANTGLNPGWLIVGGAAVALMVIGGFLYAGTRRKPRRH